MDTALIEPTVSNPWETRIEVELKASRMPPRPASADETPKANSLAAPTLIPREAAARSFVRTAINWRPTSLRRMLHSNHTATANQHRQKIVYERACVSG